MSFEDVAGHDTAIQILQRAAATGRLPNAYLFVGPPNVGKTLVGVEFAKALNCENVHDQADPASVDPCDECAPCQAIGRENFADFMIIRPTTKLEDRTSTDEEEPDEAQEKRDRFVEMDDAMIRIDDIRERLLPHVSLKRSSGRRKMYVLCRVETMNLEAANAFLKTLEEPPPATTFILTATNTSELLPTTVSRCQVIHFNPVPADVATDFLERKYPDQSTEHLEALVAMSDGRIGWAQRLLEHPEALEIRDDLFDLCIELHEAGMVDSLRGGEKIIEAAERWWLVTNEPDMAERALKASRTRVLRVTMRNVIDILLTWFRDLLLVASDGQAEGLINIDRRDDLLQLAGDVKPEASRKACTHLHDLKEQLRGNVNLQLAAETLALRLTVT